MGSFLLIGPPFTGKTRSLGTHPGRGILFNFELEGYLSLRVPYVVRPTLRKWWEEKQKIEKILVVDCLVRPMTISLSKEATLNREIIRSHIEDLNTLPFHLDEFDFFAIDSLNPWAQEVLNYVTAMDGRNLQQIQDYRDAITKVMEILFRLQGLGKPLIMIAHFQSERDAITERSRQVPQVWGKNLPTDVPKWFSTVLQTIAVSDGKSGTSYLWNTKPEGLVESLGSRILDNLPSRIPQDFQKLYELVEKQKGGPEGKK